MWENNSESFNSNNKNKNHELLSSATESSNDLSCTDNFNPIFLQNELNFNESIRKSIKEMATQSNGFSLNFEMSESRKGKICNELNENPSEMRAKRGRGRGSRGSYKPRGRVRFIGSSSNGSNSSAYGSSNQIQRVCINPEILRRLGYPTSSFENSETTRQNNEKHENNFQSPHVNHFNFLCTEKPAFTENSTYLDISNPYHHQIIEFGASSNAVLNNNNRSNECYDCHREQIDLLTSQNNFQPVETYCDNSLQNSNEVYWPRSQMQSSNFELPHQQQQFDDMQNKLSKVDSNDFLNPELNNNTFLKLNKKSEEKLEENNEIITDNHGQQQQIEAFYASLVSRANSSSNLSFQNEFLNNFPFSVVNSINTTTSIFKNETSTEIANDTLFLENE